MLVGASCITSILLCTDDGAVHRPSDRFGSPINCIGVKFGCRRVNSRLSTSVVVASNAFTKVVGLHFAGVGVEVAAAPFPVDLVVSVGHQHGSSDDTLSRCGLKRNFHTTKHHIEPTPDVRRITSFCEGELGPIGAVFHNRVISERPIGGMAGGFGKIDGILCRRQARDGRTCSCSVVSGHSMLRRIREVSPLVGSHCALVSTAYARALSNSFNIIISTFEGETPTARYLEGV